jgi:calcium/proton exchanger cax
LPPSGPFRSHNSTLVGWFSNISLDYNYGLFECSAVFVAILASAFVQVAGKSHWISGTTLLIMYVTVSVAFFFFAN